MEKDKIDISTMMKFNEVEDMFEWSKWHNEIPFMQLPEGYQFKVVPPSLQAIVRFIVKFKDREVSVYLDGYDKLVYVGKPYWEIYPNSFGDAERFLFGKEEEMIQAIKRILEE